MKVLAFVILIIGSSSGLGSGPYLPSGWRPSGPAFYLPTEMDKPASAKVEAAIQETETSGSAFLKEYGPPKLEVEVETSETGSLKEYGAPEPVKVELEVSQDLIQQALPEINTEQAFVSANLVEEDKSAVAEVVESIVENSEAIISDDTETATLDITEEAVTESAKIQDETSEVLTVDQTESTVLLRSENIQENTEVTQNEQEVSKESSAVVEEKIEEEVRVQAVEAGVKNIAEAIVTLENEVKDEEVAALKTVQQNTGSIQAPEGFLEYGPPGFTEYGPPKGDLKTEPVVESLPASETNETRRRRFSPKFKAPKRKN